MVAPLLVLAVGNESRGDDALGPLLSRRLADWVAGTEMAVEVELIEEFQLQVENTLDLEDRKLALFIDAGNEPQSPFAFYQAVKQQMEGHTSHAVAPEALLGVYAMVHDEEPPPMFVLCVAGSAFELGEPLSPQARLNLEQAFDFACNLLQQPGLNSWQGLALSHAEDVEPAIVAALL